MCTHGNRGRVSTMPSIDTRSTLYRHFGRESTKFSTGDQVSIAEGVDGVSIRMVIKYKILSQITLYNCTWQCYSPHLIAWHARKSPILKCWLVLSSWSPCRCTGHQRYVNQNRLWHMKPENIQRVQKLLLTCVLGTRVMPIRWYKANPHLPLPSHPAKAKLNENFWYLLFCHFFRYLPEVIPKNIIWRVFFNQEICKFTEIAFQPRRKLEKSFEPLTPESENNAG